MGMIKNTMDEERENASDGRVRILRIVCYDKECSVRNGCELMSNVLCIFISHTEAGLGDHTVTKQRGF